MHRTPFTFAVVATLSLGVLSAQENKPKRQLPQFMPSLLRYHSGDALPDMTALRGDGTEWHLSAQKGKVQIVGMVAVDVAKDEAPAVLQSLKGIADRYRAYGVEAVAAINWAQPDAAKAWIGKHGAQWPFTIVCDPVAPYAGDKGDNDTRMAHHKTTLMGRMFGGGMTPPLPAWFIVDGEQKLVGSFRIPNDHPEQVAEGIGNLLLKAGVKLEAKDMPATVVGPEFWVKKAPRPAEAPVAPIAVGAVAPDFVMKDAAGKEVKLSDYAGKVVVLDFWATWCGPCKAALPHVQELAKHYKAQGVVVVASCTNDGRAEFEEYVAEHGAKYPDVLFLHDPKERSAERASRTLYGVGGIPHQFVIGRDGKIASEVIGYMAGEVLLDAALVAAGIEVDAATKEKAAADRAKREQMDSKPKQKAVPLQPK